MGIPNFIAIAIDHQYVTVALSFLASPIDFIILKLFHSFNFEILLMAYSFIAMFIPLFWPIVILILLSIKRKCIQYGILIFIYIFTGILILSNILSHPGGIFDATWVSSIYLEIFGIILFILGQIGIFYVLKLKNKGRLK